MKDCKRKKKKKQQKTWETKESIGKEKERQREKITEFTKPAIHQKRRKEKTPKKQNEINENKSLIASNKNGKRWNLIGK